MSIAVRITIALLAAVVCVGTQTSTKNGDRQTPVSAEEQTNRPSQVKVESAMRFRTLVSGSSDDWNCVHLDSSQNSCLLVKTSGVSLKNFTHDQGPNSLATYVWAGDARYRFETMRGRDGGEYILLIFTVPKELNEFRLTMGDMPSIAFKVSTTVIEKISEDELFKDQKQD